MKKIRFSTLPVYVLAALFIVACQDNPDLQNIDTDVAEDALIADAAYDDIFSEVDAIMNLADEQGYEESNLKSATTQDPCPVIYISSDGDAFWPRTIVVDYGEGCDISRYSDTRERVRKGKIIIKISGPMWQEGSSREVTFEDFYINDHQVEGRRTVTNEGFWEDGDYVGLRYFSVILDGGMVTTPEGKVISKDVNRTRTFVEGFDTKWDTRDDIWHINGIASGVNHKGIAFSREITSPLWKEIGCRFITKGTVLIQAEGRPDATLDYGDGTCDPLVTVTVNGDTKEINLRRW